MIFFSGINVLVMHLALLMHLLTCSWIGVFSIFDALTDLVLLMPFWFSRIDAFSMSNRRYN